MSKGDRSHYADAITTHSRGELADVLAAVEPPVCLLGGWAVYVHVTEPFRSQHGRSYIGSRDIDLGVHIDPEWTPEALADEPVSTTLDRIERGLGYERGRFGFYQEFHRETGTRLDPDEARRMAPHRIFRVDIDIIPDSTRLAAFEARFGFRPPAEPLLEGVFRDGSGERLDGLVDWDVPGSVEIVPQRTLGAMKIRALPDRDESHKRVKDLADLHALLWYGTEYDVIASAVRAQIRERDVTAFESAIDDPLYARAASLIGTESTVVRRSIERLFE